MKALSKAFKGVNTFHSSAVTDLPHLQLRPDCIFLGVADKIQEAIRSTASAAPTGHNLASSCVQDQLTLHQAHLHQAHRLVQVILHQHLQRQRACGAEQGVRRGGVRRSNQMLPLVLEQLNTWNASVEVRFLDMSGIHAKGAQTSWC